MKNNAPTKAKPAEESVSRRDIDILRSLAERKTVIANDPVNVERRAAWHALDSGMNSRVMVLAEHSGVRDKEKPCIPTTLACSGKWARGVETALRTEIALFEELKDDHVVEPFMNVKWIVKPSDYGVQEVVHKAGDADHMGACSWDPPIKDLDADFGKLRPRTFTVDRESTLAQKDRLEKVFGGILPVRLRGSFYWTMGMTIVAIKLIGLEQLMLAMYDNPAGLHRLMAFLRDDHMAHADWLEREGLYSLNNENDYIGSGSMGYSRALPGPGWREGSAVHTRDLWVLLESQETVGVGPDLFEEFIFPYQASIAERFGLVYYGCCGRSIHDGTC